MAQSVYTGSFRDGRRSTHRLQGSASDVGESTDVRGKSDSDRQVSFVVP